MYTFIIAEHRVNDQIRPNLYVNMCLIVIKETVCL